MDKAAASRISVIIPTYHRHAVLAEVLDCLAEQTLAPDEVIVVDQTPAAARPPGFYDRYEGRLPLRVVDLDVASSTRARNEGARRATGDILCFLDDKIQGDARLLENHVQVMEEHRVDAVHGAVIINTESLGERFAWEPQRKLLDPAMVFMISPNCQWEGMTLGVSTANMSIRAAAYWRAGGMDEIMSGRYDDIEFAYRLFRSGAKVYFSPKPVVRNRRLKWGGAYQDQRHGTLSRLWRPRPHPNYLYFHRKHLPGWPTTQLLLKPFVEAYWPSRHWLRRPWILLLTPVRVMTAVVISGRMLRRLRERGGKHAIREQ